MKCREFDELATLAAAGALDRAGEVRLEAWLTANAESRDELGAWKNAIASFAIARSKPVVPSASVRSRLLERISKSPQSSGHTADNTPGKGFQFIPESGGEWIPSMSPGSRIKVLSSSLRRNYVMLLMDVVPGGKIPEHKHTGDEELYVLSGNLQTEGRLMGPGDFLHSSGGTTHHELISPDGCRALLLVPYTWAVGTRLKDAFRKAMGKTVDDPA